MSKLTLIMTIIFSSTFASAEGGNSGGGGGDAVKTKTGWSLLDLSERVSYEYFAPLKDDEVSGHFFAAMKVLSSKCKTLIRTWEYTNLSQWKGKHDYDIDISRIIQFVAANGKFTDGEKGRIANKALQIFKQLIWAGTDTPLQEISDEGTVRLIDEATKQQVAVQNNGTVLIYLPIYNKMDAKSRAALLVHEAILQAVLTLNPLHYQTHGTSVIRKLVRTAFSAEADSLPEVTFGSMCNLEGALFKESGLPPVK